MTPTQALLIESHRERRARWAAKAYVEPKALPAPAAVVLQFPHVEIAGADISDCIDMLGGASPLRIIGLVSLKYGVPVADILGMNRSAYIARVRTEAMYLVKTHVPTVSTRQLSALFGGRDHTTVMQALARREKRAGSGSIAAWCYEWTPERVAQYRGLRSKGLVQTECAKLMGITVKIVSRCPGGKDVRGEQE